MESYTNNTTGPISLSSILLIGLALLLIATFISVVTLTTIRPTAFTQLLPSQGSLAIPTKVGTIEQVRSDFFNSGGSTFSCFLYCGLASKTTHLVKDPIPLVQFGKSVQFQILPGGVSTAPKAQLAILTQGSTVSTEIIDVKEFPMQKWVYLTITREGRRFTVLYDGKAVSSGRTQYYPLVVSSAILLGNERLRGQFAKPRLVGTVLSQSEIVTYQQQSADTKNKPYMESSIWSSIQDVFTVSFGCPNGIFCFSTSTPPLQDPTKSWKSAYA